MTFDWGELILGQEQSSHTEEQATPKESFFQRFKKKYGLEKEADAPAEQSVQEEQPEEEPRLPEGRGVMQISEQSLLFALWRDWMHEQGAEAKDFYLVLEKPGEVPAPIDDEAMEAEKNRLLVKFLMESKKRHRLVRMAKGAKAAAEKADGATEATAEVQAHPTDLDADAVIHIPKGALGAWMMLYPPVGEGKPLSYDELMERIEAEGIVFGVDEARLHQLAENPVYFDTVLIARGQPEVHGKDGWIKEYYPRELSNTFATDENGNMDYRSAANTQVVHEGDVICEAIPPTEGIPGKKVTGTELPAEPGKPVKLPSGTNTCLNEEQNKLLAAKDGNLQFIRECFCVQPLFHVNGDVDYGVGNIDFPGDVHITGDVKNGFVVKAKGNIMIDGLVEGAVLEAGGNISIRKGVLGDNRAVLRSPKCISAQYLENCVIYVGDKVETSSIITSDVFSDNAIIVRFGRGTIIGGNLVATNLISANVIGCRAERVTELTIGEVPMLKQEREEVLAQLAELDKQEATLGSNISYLDIDDIDEAEEKARNRAQRLAKFRLQRSVLTVQKAQLYKKLDELDQKETDASKCKVLCDTIYPRTRISFGGISCTIDQQIYHCNVHVQDGELVTY